MSFDRFPYLKAIPALAILLWGWALFQGCGQIDTTAPAGNPTSNEAPRYLYVAGAAGCYGGGVTTATASAANAVARFELGEMAGVFDKMVCDWSPFTGDTPISIQPHWTDSNLLLVLIENATSGRRVDLCNKTTGEITTYLTSAGLATVLRHMIATPDGSLLISDSGSIEKYDTLKNRILNGANAFIQAPAGNCATAATLISTFEVTPVTGRILYAHAAATPNNHMGFISSTGYAVAGDCLNTSGKIAAPTTTALPTGMLIHSSGKLLVTYGSTTGTSNFVYAYDFDETNATTPVSGATQAYLSTGIVNGPSAIVEDTETSEVYVSNVLSTLNTVERFTFNPTTKTLTRVGSTAFIGSQLFSRCIADLYIGN